ncbi:GNAT family N-acetyltransferase [Nicoliella spurrieriana]|uniref:GNAT family N-acetyltransferase n=1 Tax=Nicoliella spurrieriana TaxID=2925830 RepID=A0A976RSW9_9LACO|nr:GNAT family N-acetyltransferase [Nicoliella spurrieriana]UQS87273.1 GNAT family N-acetyltransferase [Nicoliella spurrieriana]
MFNIEALIEQCTVNDVRKLQEISRKTFYDTFAADSEPTDMARYLESAFNIDKLTKEIQNPESFFYFVRLDQEIVGYLKVNIGDAQTEPMGADTLEIQRIYIDVDSKHKGLGGQLYDKAISEAKQHHKNKVWLGVWEHNPDAQGFYAHKGFKQFGDHEFIMGSEHQRDLLMEKSI